MAKTAGRDCVIKKAGTAIAGLTTNSMTVNGAPIPVGSKSNDGLAVYLSGVMTGKSIELSGEGYEEDGILRALALGADSGKFLTDISYYFANGDVISGNFVMIAYSETGADEDGETFSATFASDGQWTFTPAV